MKIFYPMTLALLAILTPDLQAQTMNYGVQGLANIPLGDLKDFVDSKPGPGFGVHVAFDMGEGHMLRPRLDYSVFPEASFATLKQSASSFSLGGDYLYFIAEKPEGLYLTGGLAAVRWSFQSKVGALRTTSDTTKIGIAMGLGYQWNATLGTELRFLQSSVASNFKAQVLQVGVTLRF